MQGAGLDWGAGEGEVSDEELDMEGVELPDNLTFISSKGADAVQSPGGKKDWGTGIQVLLWLNSLLTSVPGPELPRGVAHHVPRGGRRGHAGAARGPGGVFLQVFNRPGVAGAVL